MDDTAGIVAVVAAVGVVAREPVAAVDAATSSAAAAVDIGGGAAVVVGALERPHHKATCAADVGDVVKGRGLEAIVERGERDELLLSLGPSLLPLLLLPPAVAAEV